MSAKSCVLVSAIFAICVAFETSQAATIIKLDLGGVGPDLSYTGGPFGFLETVDNNPAGKIGDQATSILFTGFLSSMPTTTGSYSLNSASASGSPTPLGSGVYAQNFSGGNFQLYDSGNVLLLDVGLTNSLLVGGGNGAFFNITNGIVVGGFGPLISQLGTNSIGMSISLTNISGGGLSVSGAPGSEHLNAFFADATKEITATQVPEPATILLVLGGLTATASRRRRG